MKRTSLYDYTSIGSSYTYLLEKNNSIYKTTEWVFNFHKDLASALGYELCIVDNSFYTLLKCIDSAGKTVKGVEFRGKYREKLKTGVLFLAYEEEF